MEQMSIFDSANQSWQDFVNEAISQIEIEDDIPNNSVLIDANYSRDGSEITSYSLFIRKPDYPKGVNASGSIKTSLCNIQFAGKTGSKKIVFCLPESALHVIMSEWNIEIKRRKSENFVRVIIDPINPYFGVFCKAVIKELVDRYLREGSGNGFGCCHLYNECSDAKRCLHENKLYARGCQYYYNLNAGRIFYGKNKSIQ